MNALLLLLLSAAPVTFSGQVLDTDGDPVPDATVELRDVVTFDGPPGARENVVRATTDAAGRFSARADFEARLAHAQAKGYAQTGEYYMKEWVSVPESRVVKLTLRKNPIVTVTGAVVDEANAPLSGAMVSRKSGGRETAVFTDAAGNFSLPLPSRETTFWVYRKGYVQQDVARTDAPMKIVMVKRPTLAVYLLDARGQPMKGSISVEAHRPDGAKIANCNTREVEGDCTLEAEVGEVTVTATVGGKTVKQVVRVENSKKVDVTLRF